MDNLSGSATNHGTIVGVTAPRRTTPTPGQRPDSSVESPPTRSGSRAARFDRLNPLVEQQLRVVRRSQLRGLGWTHDHVEHEIAFGRWQALTPEVLATQNAPLTDEQRLWLGVLRAGPGAVLSHWTACAVAGLSGWDDGAVHVLSRKSHTLDPLPGFRFHESRRPFANWIQPAGAPPRLRVEPAMLLCAERDRSVRRGLGLLAAGVQQRLTTADRLVAASREITKLRRGKLIRLALADIAGGAQSLAEIDVGRLCRSIGLQPPLRQVVRKDKTGRRRYLDCEWRLPDGRILVLEIDGSFHLTTEHWWRDMERERAIVISGRLVLRCSSIEVRLAPYDVMRDLERAGVPRQTTWAA